MKVAQLVALLAVLHGTRSAEICCGNHGCYNDNPPFGAMPLPDCPASMNPLGATMFTRSNPNNGQVVSDTTVPAVFDPSHRTVFLVHGWNSNGNSAWLHQNKDAFLEREDINAVVVDWGGGAEILNYNKAASNTRAVGGYLSSVIQNLLGVSGSSSARMWCVGHSLGSHVCGHTGMRLPAHLPLGRATGLDPAGPLFEINADKTIGINPTSATFVDILHTDSFGLTKLGTSRDLGHIDFYPNGGANMPGCSLRDGFTDDSFQGWNDETPGQFDSCSHGRVTVYMIESTKRDCFHSTQRCSNYNQLPGSCTGCPECGSAFPCSYMGYAAESSCNRTGIFYLTVTANAPYCVN